MAVSTLSIKTNRSFWIENEFSASIIWLFQLKTIFLQPQEKVRVKFGIPS